MVDPAKSLLDRLRTRARQTGKSYQLLLQLFCQEEFLRRMQFSKYRNNLILKGGFLLYSISGYVSRPTVDIDFLIRYVSNAEENINAVVSEIINCNAGNDFVKFKISGTERIAEHREYNGVRVKIVAHIKNTRTPFDLDIGVGDIIVPKPEIRKLPAQIVGFDEPEVMTYSLESTVAEKFDAIISRMELTSRMKDFYDIYYLANSYPFDARVLQEAI